MHKRQFFRTSPSNMPIDAAVSHRQNLPTAQMNLAYIPITLDAMSSKQEENIHE